jgi:iron(III) transport system substrate-binding protein
VIPAEGIGYEGNYCTILKGTKKLDQAKKVMDYLGTKDASEFLASMGYIPPRPGIPSALYGAAKPTFIKLDHGWAMKRKERPPKKQRNNKGELQDGRSGNGERY